MMRDGEIELGGGRIALGGGTLLAGGAVAFAVLLWLGAFLSGLAPWLGYVDKTYRDASSVGLSVAAGTASGGGFGPASFAFLEGQEVFVDYDITIRRGAVLINVLDYAGMDRILWQTVATSGTGTATVRVPRTGLYRISIEPTVVGGVGRGYDLDISATWGARWP